MTTVDKIEVEKFSRLAKDWWNPKGKFRPLHLFNPARIEFIKEKLISYFELNPHDEAPLKNLKILDIGCGGGLLCEPLNRLVAIVTGIDASNDNIEVAKLHSREMGLDIKGINIGGMFAFMVKLVQELKKKNEDSEDKVKLIADQLGLSI